MSHCFHVFVKHHYSIKFSLGIQYPSGVWNRMPWRNLCTIVLGRDFLYVHLQSFHVQTESMKMRTDLSESHSEFSHVFSQLQIKYDWDAWHCKNWQLYHKELCLCSSYCFRGHFSQGRGCSRLSFISLRRFLYRLHCIIEEVCHQLPSSSTIQEDCRFSS